MAPLVSVIVPVYNVSPYLRQCMDSIVNQTLKDIEIICVDDGSTDDSLAILQEYAEHDSRIAILQQENKGAGVARNLGMTKATGKYLSFLDSDDFFEKNMLQDAYIAGERDSSDFVIYNAYSYDNSTKLDVEFFVIPSLKAMKKPFCFKDVPNGCLPLITKQAPWNKLFKKSFVVEHNLKFSMTRYANDAAFTMAASYLAQKITHINRAYVHYRQNIRTNLQSSAHKDWKHYIQISNDLLCTMAKSDNFKDIKQDIQNIILKWLTNSMYRFFKNNEFKNIIEMGDYLRNDGFEILGLKNISPKSVYCGDVYHIYSKILHGKQITFSRNKYTHWLSSIFFKLYYNPKYILHIHTLGFLMSYLIRNFRI